MWAFVFECAITAFGRCLAHNIWSHLLNLKEVQVRPVRSTEEQRFQELMQEQHYLGALPKIGETLWYVGAWQDEWVALLSFSAAAWKCAARDRWIGWDFRHQYDLSEAVGQQQSFSDPEGLAFPQLRFAPALFMFPPDCPGLAGGLWPSLVALGDLCGPAALPRNRVSGSQLGVGG